MINSLKELIKTYFKKKMWIKRKINFIISLNSLQIFDEFNEQ